MLNPWLGISLVATALMGCMLALKRYSSGRDIPAELLRKGLHICMGIVTLSFPWLFSATWPVVILAAISVLWLWSVPRCQIFQRYAGGVTDGVSRCTWGEIYFPIAITLVFWWSRGDALLYSIPVLVLTFADSLAAIVGLRWGAHRYSRRPDAKSWEGSAVFFCVTVCAIYLPLVGVAGTTGARALFVAIATALLVTMLEAGSRSGWDNLSVPLGTLVMLKALL